MEVPGDRWNLRVGHEHLVIRHVIQASIMHVARDADHLARPLFTGHREGQIVADGIRAGPIFSRHRLIYDDYPWSGGGIVRIERTPLQEWGFKSTEKIHAHRVKPGRWQLGIGIRSRAGVEREIDSRAPA